MKSPVSVTVVGPLAAPANSRWVTVDYHAKGFAVGLFVMPSSDATGVGYTVQFTPDNPDISSQRQPASITRAATTATVVDPLHGLSTGDNIQVINTGDPNLDGNYDITVVDQNTYTYTVANTGLLAALPPAKLNSFRVFPHATLVALSARAAGNFAFPPIMCRLHVATLTAGQVTLEVVQGEGR